ncbi:MAG: ion channel [Bacteroidota bacterium]|nr:ion channel [Bacteroidota bacterium]
MSFKVPNKKFKEANETGFSKQGKSQGSRLVNRDGSFNVIRTGQPFFKSFNFYNELILLSWTNFTLFVLAFYFVVNLIFGIIYYLIGIENLGGAIADTEIDKFLEAFFFSTQTFATVGYGRINPTGVFTNFLASIEALFGVLSLALVTSLLYSRFAKPKINLIFSENIIVAPYKDIKAIMFRFANTTRQQLLECEVQLMISFKLEENGKLTQKYVQLPLEVSKAAALALNWTIVHALNDESPLKDFTQADYLKSDMEFIISIKAFDNTYSQVVYDRYSYKSSEMVFGVKFVIPFHPSDDGISTVLELDKIGLYEKV